MDLVVVVGLVLLLVVFGGGMAAVRQRSQDVDASDLVGDAALLGEGESRG